MTDYNTTDSYRDLISLEIQSRKIVLKKIENVYNRLKKQAEANYEKRKLKVQQTTHNYKTVDEAHDAWGYDCITEAEYEEIKRIFELGDEYLEKHISPQEAAAKILGRFICGLYTEIRSFEFELLSPEEQLRILQERERKHI